ncbi:MAG: lipoprotein [Dokdonella sp.]
MSSHRSISRIAALLLAAVLLTACGNKGDLVKPTPKPTPPASTPAAPAADAAKH